MRDKKIIIVGGGFAGVRTALDLSRRNPPHTKIFLISEKSHFEYQASLYRILVGHSPLEVCIPLREIFSGTQVEVVEDVIVSVDPKKNTLTSTSGELYHFDELVLAVGSETAFFNIPGLKDHSFGFKSITEALALKRHFHELFASCQRTTPEAKICAAHVVIIGGGASGTEIAGVLGEYLKQLALNHGLDESLVTIDLIEAAPRLLPFASAEVSKKVKERLNRLGINIFLNRTVIKQEVEEVFLKDLEMKTNTLIWTAGTTTNHLYKTIPGVEFDKKGRVLVDSQLRAQPFKNIFVIGDAASTPLGGTALSALDQGWYVARVIFAELTQETVPVYRQKKHGFVIPIGSHWAATTIGKCTFYGRLGWWYRRYIDFKFTWSILPLKKAWIAFQNDRQLVESCSICAPKQ